MEYNPFIFHSHGTKCGEYTSYDKKCSLPIFQKKTKPNI